MGVGDKMYFPFLVLLSSYSGPHMCFCVSGALRKGKFSCFIRPLFACPVITWLAPLPATIRPPQHNAHSQLTQSPQEKRTGWWVRVNEWLQDLENIHREGEESEGLVSAREQRSIECCHPGGGVVTSVETAERDLHMGKTWGTCTKYCYYTMLVYLKLHPCLCVEDTGTFSMQTCLHSCYF